jgi:hypothetical protein
MADTATTPLQEQVLETITTAQDATLKVFRGWTKTLASTPNINDLFTVPKVDTFYGFAEKVWAAQRDFIVGLLEVATEAGKTVPDNVKRTAERATHAAAPSGSK